MKETILEKEGSDSIMKGEWCITSLLNPFFLLDSWLKIEMMDRLLLMDE